MTTGQTDPINEQNINSTEGLTCKARLINKSQKQILA